MIDDANDNQCGGRMDTLIVKNLGELVNHTSVFDLLTEYTVFRGQSVRGNLLPGIARAQGKIAGRKDALSVVAAKRGMSADALHAEIRAKLAAGSTARALAKEYGVSHPTIGKAAAD